MANPKVILDMRKLEEIERTSPGKANDMVLELALTCEQIAKTSMGTSPPGRTYQRGGVSHTASQPGFPPHVDTGELHAGIKASPAGRMRAVVDVEPEHGLYMEYGAPARNIAPRPFLLPAVEQTAAEAGRKGILKKVVTDE